MKRHLLIALLALLLLPISGFAAKPLYVQVKGGEVRATPTFLGKLAGKAPLGTQVTVLKTKGAWTRIKSTDGKLTGWMHTSSLHKKKVKMKAGDKDAAITASAGEMSAATKGFTPEVEAEYRKRNPKVSFEWVDKMEAIKVKDDDIGKFLKEGKITPKEGE